MHTKQPLLLFTVAVFALAVSSAAKPAFAESSSWFGRIDPEEQPPKNSKSPPRSQRFEKGAATTEGSSDHQKSSSGVAIPAGDDPAYAAFDQGKYLTALKLAEEAAAKGDPQAHTLVGRLYAEGLGVPKNEKLAADWYKRAVDLGDAPAKFELAIMLAEGRGIDKDRTTAAQLFEDAARSGHALANYNLGLLFLKGDGKPENPFRAAQHIIYAAEKGVARAQYDAAALYQQGAGVEFSALEAGRWLSRAAAQGLAEAQYDYAVLLLRGQGLTKDEPKAIGYLKSAANKGIPGAQNRLAYVYLDGIGGDKNPVEAAKWRFIAKKSGFADETLDASIAKLGKKDLQTAETAAAEWTDRIQLGPVN